GLGGSAGRRLAAKLSGIGCGPPHRCHSPTNGSDALRTKAASASLAGGVEGRQAGRHDVKGSAEAVLRPAAEAGRRPPGVLAAKLRRSISPAAQATTKS